MQRAARLPLEYYPPPDCATFFKLYDDFVVFVCSWMLMVRSAEVEAMIYHEGDSVGIEARRRSEHSRCRLVVAFGELADFAPHRCRACWRGRVDYEALAKCSAIFKEVAKMLRRAAEDRDIWPFLRDIAYWALDAIDPEFEAP